jgi:hypothetical protein
MQQMAVQCQTPSKILKSARSSKGLECSKADIKANSNICRVKTDELKAPQGVPWMIDMTTHWQNS